MSTSIRGITTGKISQKSNNCGCWIKIQVMTYKIFLLLEMVCVSVEGLTVSSRGQVVLPVSMSRKLSITSGSKLAAYTSGGVIVLKVIELPTESDFKSVLDKAEM